MDEFRLSKKLSNENLYTILLICGLIAFFLFREIVMLVLLAQFERTEPGITVEFSNLLLEENYKAFTENMWKAINLSQFFGNLLILVPLVFLLRKVFVNDFFKLKKDLLNNLGIIAFGFIIMLYGQSLLARIYGYFGIVNDSANQELIEYALSAKSGIYMVLSVVLIAPLLEELIFRKLFFGFFEEKLKMPKIVVIILSACVFAALHATDIFFFQYLFLALVLTCSYALFKNNIIISIGIHFLNNAMILLYVCIM